MNSSSVESLDQPVLSQRLLLVTLALMLLTAPAIKAAQPKSDDAFHLTLTPYLWMAGVTGDIIARGSKSNADSSFLDIADNTDSIIGLSARIEARKGRWGAYADGTYIQLGVDEVAKRLGSPSVTFEQYFVDFGLLYRVGDWPLGEVEGDTRFKLDLTVGGRFVHMGSEIDLDLAGTSTQNRDWIDPTIGAQAQIDLHRNWMLQFRGDIGGFGAASDFTWTGFGAVAWRFSMGSSAEGSIFLGYKAIGYDYTDGDGLNEFAWDAVQHGPVVGMSFAF